MHIKGTLKPFHLRTAEKCQSGNQEAGVKGWLQFPSQKTPNKKNVIWRCGVWDVLKSPFLAACKVSNAHVYTHRALRAYIPGQQIQDSYETAVRAGNTRIPLGSIIFFLSAFTPILGSTIAYNNSSPPWQSVSSEAGVCDSEEPELGPVSSHNWQWLRTTRRTRGGRTRRGVKLLIDTLSLELNLGFPNIVFRNLCK